jgi:hydroxypyruvate isomerase
LQAAGVTLVLEPLNLKVDHAGYFLSRSDEAFQLVRGLNNPHIKVLFDIYHQQITEGNLLSSMADHLEWIGHIHAAGNPGRRELYDGEIHYGNVLSKLREIGYEGYVGLEYFPKDEPLEGLKRSLQLFEA